MAQLNGTSQVSGQVASGTISTGVVITGNVACEGNLQISGQIDGEVRGATVFVDETGIVTGAIEADQLRVHGVVSGRIVVNDLAVEAGGSVDGDTTYQRMKVASGAILQGTLTYRKGAEAKEAPAAAVPIKAVQPTVPVNPRHVFVD